MRATILCLAAIAQLVLSTVSAEPITVPLYKRTDSGKIYKAAGKALDNGVLAGKVNIGTPPQEFVFAFDTTTGYSWVRGSRCKTANCRGRCTYYATKSKDAVSTGQKFSAEYGDSCVDTHIYHDTFEFAGLTVPNMPFGGAYRMEGFGTGFDGYLGLGRPVDFNCTKVKSSAASGLAKRDADANSSSFVSNALQLGSGITSSQFGMYTNTASSSGFDQSGSGDTTTAPAATTAATNATMVNGTTTNGTTTAPVAGATTTTTPAGTSSGSTTDVTGGGFGVVKRSTSSKSENPAGYLVIGGIDKSVIQGDVEYIRLSDDPSNKAKNWEVCILHASFGGDVRFRQEPNAVASISTSTSFIAIPPKQADAFHAKFGATYDSNTKLYNIKCSEIKNLPALKMTLEDHILELPASYWTGVADSGRDCCTTKISRGSSDRDWVLGTALTNAFYTTFDPENETIGFGILKGQADNGLKIYKKSH